MVIVIVAQTSTLSCAARRNLADYRLFGPHTVPYSGNVQEMYANLREFLWANWREKERAHAVLTTFSFPEGVRCTGTYIVEPGKDGRWRFELEEKCEKGRPRTFKTRAYSIERLKRDSRGRRTEEKLPDTAEAPGRDYVLRLLDQSGNRLREL